MFCPKIAILLCWLSFLFCHHDQKKITLFSIGDSTMENLNVEELSAENGGQNYPLRGWMMAMPPFFNDNIVIKNMARGGRSSKSFRTEGRWDTVMNQLKPGDYVFIQFGHNDRSSDPYRHTDPRTTFRENLLHYIQETRQKDGIPVLLTSIVKRLFDSAQNLIDVHGEYVTVVRELALETHTPLIDLNKKSAELVRKMGPEESKKMFLYIPPQVFTKLPQGLEDNTHLNEYGAKAIAELAVQGIKELHLPLMEYLKN